MRYISTHCPHCGYAIRHGETQVPKVQIGPPVQPCPKCRQLCLDPIATEYEFMTEEEKNKFTSQHALLRSLLSTIIFFIIGISFLIGGISEEVTGAIVAGIINIVFSVLLTAYNIYSAKNKNVEQWVYESLQRTSIPLYLEMLKNVYSTNNVNRKYSPYVRKTEFLKSHKNFETRKSYIDSMQNFNDLLERLKIQYNNIPYTKTRITNAH